MKIAVMTDSTSYLPQHIIDQYNISVASLSVTFDDGVNFTESDDFSVDDFYKKMASSKTIPTTSQPAIGDWIENFERLREQGYTDVIVINLSSGISGSYPSATQAGEMVEDIQVHTFDSRLAAMIEGSFAIYAAQLVQKGYKPDDIINELTEIRQHIGAYLIVDDLKNLQKSGRITGAQAWVGTLLKMKPVLHFEEDGKIHPHEKVRTKKRALKSLETNIFKEIEGMEDVTVFVINGDKTEDGKSFLQQLKEDHPNVHIQYCEFGPVIASHLGSGGLGLGYFPRRIDIN
ncbi:fatty acid kinase binding subunit FakB1 [Staphylococcus epidermidis]|uniref:fatty acid kinase binding subunit FakB1 n=1 Tax=Staphylococcus epidermidis TaxID=1282 RepID=UPI0029024973|nr:fatty acid kinase binding subunit FakB1 [Staphylococcus epidermidis]MCG2382065.1 fatty acid kinase binding subunit FakB1 [Staphylococcus epidermidis]MDU0427749.1 fatty acid kinase binding subunit FakB1 [Staphylococcus epidermidis]MDU0432639.1 fatty acid kinase binding subunit FakB1 [Staphylococcus epidermidis]MDU0446990.1 fatty acid kinase binding subunit FakB1 [Staphylococcus epidermidis]MDU0455872.1 fatty acid kinase binding subunit FakB1 [Staphylococcus epidermidis]